MSLPSKEEFLKSKSDAVPQTIVDRYSAPSYYCPKCKSGRMRKDNYSGVVLTSFPPIYVFTYVCDRCRYSEQNRD